MDNAERGYIRPAGATRSMSFYDVDIYGRGSDVVYGPGAELENARLAKIRLKQIRDVKSGTRVTDITDYDLYGRGDPRVFGVAADASNLKEALGRLNQGQLKKRHFLRELMFPSHAKELMRIKNARVRSRNDEQSMVSQRTRELNDAVKALPLTESSTNAKSNKALDAVVLKSSDAVIQTEAAELFYNLDTTPRRVASKLPQDETAPAVEQGAVLRGIESFGSRSDVEDYIRSEKSRSISRNSSDIDRSISSVPERNVADEEVQNSRSLTDFGSSTSESSASTRNSSGFSAAHEAVENEISRQRRTKEGGKSEEAASDVQPSEDHPLTSYTLIDERKREVDVSEEEPAMISSAAVPSASSERSSCSQSARSYRRESHQKVEGTPDSADESTSNSMEVSSNLRESTSESEDSNELHYNNSRSDDRLLSEDNEKFASEHSSNERGPGELFDNSNSTSKSRRRSEEFFGPRSLAQPDSPHLVDAETEASVAAKKESVDDRGVAMSPTTPASGAADTHMDDDAQRNWHETNHSPGDSGNSEDTDLSTLEQQFVNEMPQEVQGDDVDEANSKAAMGIPPVVVPNSLGAASERPSHSDVPTSAEREQLDRVFATDSSDEEAYSSRSATNSSSMADDYTPTTSSTESLTGNSTSEVEEESCNESEMDDEGYLTADDSVAGLSVRRSRGSGFLSHSQEDSSAQENNSDGSETSIQTSSDPSVSSSDVVLEDSDEDFANTDDEFIQS